MTDQTPGANTETPATEVLPSASEIMAFDPFAPAKEPAVDPAVTPAKTPADDKGDKGSKTPAATPLKAGEKPPEAEVPAVDPNAPVVPPVTTPAPNYEQLIREQTASITAALAPKETDVKEPPLPKYNLALPPQVLGLLQSEDPGEFATGMHAVINGISNKIWTDVETRIVEFRDKIMQEVPQLFTQQHETITTQEKVATDFYAAHPTLNNPMLKQMIQTVGMQVAAIRQAAGKSIEWGPELRDEIAEMVYVSLPQLRPTAAPAVPTVPKVPGSQPKKPPFIAGQNSRPGQAPDPTDEFTELLQMN